MFTTWKVCIVDNIAYSHITLYFYFIPLFYFIQQVLGKQSSPSTQTQKSRAVHSIGAKLSWGRWPTWVYALHIMRRKVSMCSSRNCLHYITSQQIILLQHSSIFYSLQTPTSYNSWWHTCPTLGYTTQWSVYQQSVRSNNDVEGKLFYYLNKISCNISYKVCLLQLIYSIITVQTELVFFLLK